MKRIFTLLTASVIFIGLQAQKAEPSDGYPIGQVQFTQVKVNPEGFWGQRLKASREVTIPLAFSKCEETGRYVNFERAAHPCDTFTVSGYSFDDTDVYKTIEGASYLMQTYPDKKLDNYIDSILVIVAAAQEPDGYLYTARTQNPKHPHEWAGTKRWEKVEELSHEFYNLGHLLEAAVAHYRATGKRNFLDIAIKYADCINKEIGPKGGQQIKVPGHQIAEMGLAKLYLATGNKKYLDLAKFFLDYRGKTSMKDEYNQTHKPVLEQDEAVGHAVRAAYMYSGMADVAALTGNQSYIQAIDRIWENIVGKKYYITGGIGATNMGEAFGQNYELPNSTAYCETCAAIGNVYMNYRLFLLHGESKYYDVLERTLYNGVLSGVSLDGGRFFYPNPLESHGQHERKAWFGCACCPSNISRFIPSVPGYVYAQKDRDIYVNLFMPNTATFQIEGKNIVLEQQTEYPWNGDIALNVKENKAGKFTLKIRIPGWVRNAPVPSDLYSYTDGKNPHYSITVNGQEIQQNTLDKGYVNIHNLKKKDIVRVHFDMEPRTVKAHEKVAADKGRIAIERGPLVYCAEWPDNNFNILGTIVNEKADIELIQKPDLLYGIKELCTDAQILNYDANGKIVSSPVKLTLIPYYAWAHRGKGNMMVWLIQDINKALIK
ncbi:glycoside hydrolase family 127 protein [Bacteroidaceae bacterium 14-104]|nr:glycoside hydrolase family 127 protein [Phocaeicola oris]MCE2616146.1 glycoside hydrolase family 127 protein [Phocaeicola oris]